MRQLLFVVTVAAGQMLGAWGIAYAQTVSTPPAPAAQSNSGTGAEVPNKQEVKKDEAAILPSAEGHKSSAAPTMVRDCTKNPADCTEPATPADKTTAQGVQSK